MNKVEWILATIGLLILLVVIGVVARACSTASKMADKTILNAAKNVQVYENYYNLKESYDQQLNIWKNANSEIDRLTESGKPEGQEYNNAVMRKTSAYDLVQKIIRDYNKESSIWYHQILKGKGLPERLSIPEEME